MGLALGVVAVANILGFPEAEGAEGVLAILEGVLAIVEFGKVVAKS